MPELPHETIARLESVYGLSKYDASVIVHNDALTFFEKVCGFVCELLILQAAQSTNPKRVSNLYVE